MKFKRGEVYLFLYPSGTDKSGKLILKRRPMVVLRDSNKNPDVVMLVYCTTENKSLEHECIEVLEDTEEFYNMGLTESTYIVPGITKPIDASTVIEPIGHCSLMNEIDKIISKNILK